ncbi:hypothetical protein FB45DRAFT_43627 [Roridomyces roridus]|uniref:MYND-type domain-containing protein n=1 Tax=Roridomyces roridus TaxID=1738132 RepID=A0AAD7BRT7_9AGAR|nr:hypothetical protein FB45DRAFT_43627 [Roridomyces roridus]
MQDDSRQIFPPFLARAGQACYHHSCFKGDTAPLSRCGGCRRVAYCSPECQKLDWTLHKSLCKIIAKIETSHSITGLATLFMLIPREPTADVKLLHDLTEDQIAAYKAICEFLLRRPLNSVEYHLIGQDPRCLVCTRTDQLMRIEAATNGTTSQGLIPCPDCNLTFCCSPAHWEAASALHHAPCEDTRGGPHSQCELNVELRAQLRFENALAQVRGHGQRRVWVPARVSAAWTSLEGSTWEREFGDELHKYYNIHAWSPISPWLRMVSDSLSMAMTIVYGLEKLNSSDAWTRKQMLTIHVLVGHHALECNQSIVFEEILHRLPNVKTLKMVFCGPAVPPGIMTEDLDTCPDCTQRGNKRIYEYTTEEYHQYVKRKGGAFEPPDLCVGFDSAVFAGWPEREKTYRLLSERKIRTVFTAYNREEAEMEVELLQMLGVTLHPTFGQAVKNPWGSLHPLPAGHRQYGFYTLSGWMACALN